ncbi:MAG: tRNA uracil 4-sulfurtransferase ThiI [Actinomycetota bacterium]|nr:tRNA 4-thiouridine(8) synthase ThiI [Actinomycetota bacterium]
MPVPHPNVVIAHYHEVGLKGRNRSFFERTLAENIRIAIAGTGYEKVVLISGRVLVMLSASSNLGDIIDGMSRVFGLAGFSPTFEVEPVMQALCDAAIELASSAQFSSFAIRARRGNSSFPQTSQVINETVGQAVKDHTRASVNLSAPDWTCHIELVENRAFMYQERLDAPGGLPVGSSGRALSLLSGGIDSPVASWFVAKRGAAIDHIHFHGQPFADPSSVRQATRLARALKPWTQKSQLWLIEFGPIQSEIVTSAPQELRIVLYRRFMMRIAENLAAREGHQALVTGESLGQVASQTLPNITAIDSAVGSLPVLRPLIGFDKIEIEQVAKRIGTYEISIDPHQDCCVLFVPRKVTTAARPRDLEAAELALDVPALVGKGLANAALIDI